MNTVIQDTISDNKPLVLPMWEGGSLHQHSAREFVSAEGWALLESAVSTQAFTGKPGTWLVVHIPNAQPIFVVGIEACPTRIHWSHWGAKVYAILQDMCFETVDVWIQPSRVEHSWAAVEGAQLRAYRFDHYKTKNRKTIALKEMVWIHTDTSDLLEYETLWKARTAGVHLTRDVVSEPANVLYPASMAEYAKAELEPWGVEVQVLSPEDMMQLGMHAMLGVARGSHHDARLIVLRWSNAPDQPITAIVGKGVTFDSGGISIKPSHNMEDMKYDMAGSGVVLGLFKTLAIRKASANVVGIMAMAENMPSGTAQRPSDVVRSMSGQTIEVVNTDAEGRLILADALWYVQQNYKPRTIIDLATLTGAVTVALGYEYAGLLANCDALAQSLMRIGECVDEPVWRLPLSARYDKDINSDIADMKNVGSNRGAGTITAAQFLQRFIQQGVAWAHLDIAGMAWDKKSKPLSGKGATGFGVRLLDAYLKHVYEQGVYKCRTH